MKRLSYFTQVARERDAADKSLKAAGDGGSDDGGDDGGGGGGGDRSRSRGAASLAQPILLRMTSSMDEPPPRPSERVEFDRFLASHRFLTSSNGAFWNAARKCPHPSHNDLFGGMYLIDDKDPETESHFHDLLVLALRQGGVYGLCENRTAFSAMYFDLDFKGPASSTPSADDLVSIVGMIRDVFLKVGGHSWTTASSAIVATSPKQTSSETGMEKFGAHIIFPYIILSMDSMVRLNLACRDMVESYWPDKRTPPSNSWTDVFDTSMYRTGLRMLYVDKNQKCPHCSTASSSSSSSSPSSSSLHPGNGNGHRRGRPHAVSPPTHVCTNGFVGQKRPYRIVRYVPAESDANDDAMLRRMSQDPVFALHMTSIRKPGVRREMPSSPCFDASMPTAVEASLESRRHRREEATAPTEMDTRSDSGTSATAATRPTSSSSILSNALGVPVVGQRVFIDSTDRRLAVLQKLIREYEPSRFGELSVRGATANPQGSSYVVHVSGPGRHECLNCPASAPHSRSVVYFVVDAKQGVVQKCTSRSDKAEARVSSKACRAFRAPQRAVPLGSFKDLFSNLRMVSSMNLVIDNGNVYIPKMMLVQDDEREGGEGGEEQEGGGVAEGAGGASSEGGVVVAEDSQMHRAAPPASRSSPPPPEDSQQLRAAASRSPPPPDESHHLRAPHPQAHQQNRKLSIRAHMTDPTLSPNKSNVSSSCLEISGATALFPLTHRPPQPTKKVSAPPRRFCSSSSAAALALIPSTWRAAAAEATGASAGFGSGSGGGSGGSAPTRKRTYTNELTSPDHRSRQRQGAR